MNHPPIQNSLLMYRKKSGLTQMAVAKRLSFTTAERISAWEKGKSLPSVVNLLKLSAIYRALPHKLYEIKFKDLKREIEIGPK